MNKNVTSEQYRRTITGHKGGFQTLNPNKETICIFIIPSYSFISNKKSTANTRSRHRRDFYFRAVGLSRTTKIVQKNRGDINSTNCHHEV